MCAGLALSTAILALACSLFAGAASAAPETRNTISTPQEPLAVIPFNLRGGRVLLPLRINGSDPLSFLLDTGYSMTMLRADIAAKLELKRVGGVTISGIAGDERADVFEGVTFEVGNTNYIPRRVGALPGANGRNSRSRDGIIGSGFFRRFVVEIDFAKKLVKLYEPKPYAYDGKGETIPLKFRKSTPIISASILLPGRPPVHGEFELDTGCDSGVCLGRDFVDANKLLEAAGETDESTRRGVGGGAKTKSGRIPELRIGSFSVREPSTNFFQEGSPVDAGLAGHIGMEAFNHFRVILDYSRDRMILEKAD